ncbi:hypothetical protein GCM10009591_05040 [Brachybacterium tyrofermentans]
MYAVPLSAGRRRALTGEDVAQNATVGAWMSSRRLSPAHPDPARDPDAVIVADAAAAGI